MKDNVRSTHTMYFTCTSTGKINRIQRNKMTFRLPYFMLIPTLDFSDVFFLKRSMRVSLLSLSHRNKDENAYKLVNIL